MAGMVLEIIWGRLTVYGFCFGTAEWAHECVLGVDQLVSTLTPTAGSGFTRALA